MCYFQVENMNEISSTNTNTETPAECPTTAVSAGIEVDLSTHSPRKGKLRSKIKLLQGKNRYFNTSCNLILVLNKS